VQGRVLPFGPRATLRPTHGVDMDTSKDCAVNSWRSVWPTSGRIKRMAFQIRYLIRNGCRSTRNISEANQTYPLERRSLPGRQSAEPDQRSSDKRYRATHLGPVSSSSLLRCVGRRHYGQRSCEPHEQAEHMAAPTSLQT